VTWQPVVTPLFRRRKKKAGRPLQEAIDDAARTILTNPMVGEPKVGALKGVRVYKFTHHGLEFLVAYGLDTRNRLVQFLAVGPHENFYRDLQRALRKR
jgi:mRNA-degrading endonuclease RelE of RelBE toxin-antitoxin system